jgi:glucose/arabinose dehydrogenase
MGPAAVVPRLRRGVVAALGVGALLAAVRGPGAAPAPAPSRAAAIPDVTLQPLAWGLDSITSIAHAGDSRLFLTLQRGRIVIWDGTRVLPTAFLDISNRVSCCGERGLLSVAFHPSYASNGFFFISYTDKAGNLAIARYRRLAASANRADPATGAVLLTIPHPTNANNNGGQLQFGPDGYLYAGTGDGGSADDPACRAQRDDSLLGKVLRLDVNINVTKTPFYGIPPSNPFAGAGPPLDKIWAKGLRNPRRFSFDRLTGDLYIGDAGQSTREEIDFQPRSSIGGENYGWKIMEGSLCGGGGISGCPAGVPPCRSPNFQPPIFEYEHQSGECSVTGGYVYRGSRDPRLSGVYFYGDRCTGHMWGSGQLVSDVAASLSTFGEDSAGELYVGTGTGILFRIVTSPPPPPTPLPRPALAPLHAPVPQWPTPPSPIAISEPSETWEPAEAPIPTETLEPTDTPAPTDTPVPTDTPLPPTETPAPTDTPVPTATPVPAPEPDRSVPRVPRQPPPPREVTPR